MPSGSRMGWAGAALPAGAVAMEKPLSLSCVYQSPLPPRPQAASLQPVGACLQPQEGQGRSCRQRPAGQWAPASGKGGLNQLCMSPMDSEGSPPSVSLASALSPQPAKVSGASTGHSRATERPEVTHAEPRCLLSLLCQALLTRGFFIVGPCFAASLASTL